VLVETGYIEPGQNRKSGPYFANFWQDAGRSTGNKGVLIRFEFVFKAKGPLDRHRIRKLKQ